MVCFLLSEEMIKEILKGLWQFCSFLVCTATQAGNKGSIGISITQREILRMI